MIWPLRICFSAFLFAVSTVNWAQAQGTVQGTVILADANKGAGQPKADYSNVAVWLEPPAGVLLPHSGRKHAVMLQKDKRFTPHLLVVESGTSIDFPNKDPIFHNAFSNFDGQMFDIGLYPPGTSQTQTFNRPGIVRVFCNIHSTMSAIIVVVKSPYFASTAADGSFAIRNVEPGSYVLHFFHERALPETLERLTRPIKVTDRTIELPAVSISEAGYLPSAHKNKYGRNYPVDPSAAERYGVSR
jgi:plastocyanin